MKRLIFYLPVLATAMWLNMAMVAAADSFSRFAHAHDNSPSLRQADTPPPDPVDPAFPADPTPVDSGGTDSPPPNDPPSNDPAPVDSGGTDSPPPADGTGTDSPPPDDGTGTDLPPPDDGTDNDMPPPDDGNDGGDLPLCSEVPAGEPCLPDDDNADTDLPPRPDDENDGGDLPFCSDVPPGEPCQPDDDDGANLPFCSEVPPGEPCQPDDGGALPLCSEVSPGEPCQPDDDDGANLSLCSEVPPGEPCQPDDGGELPLCSEVPPGEPCQPDNGGELPLCSEVSPGEPCQPDDGGELPLCSEVPPGEPCQPDDGGELPFCSEVPPGEPCQPDDGSGLPFCSEVPPGEPCQPDDEGRLPFCSEAVPGEPCEVDEDPNIPVCSEAVPGQPCRADQGDNLPFCSEVAEGESCQPDPFEPPPCIILDEGEDVANLDEFGCPPPFEPDPDEIDVVCGIDKVDYFDCTPEELAELQLTEEQYDEYLTNINPEFIDDAFLANLEQDLPPGWNYDRETLEFIPPPGTKLDLRNYELPPEELEEGLDYPLIPDLSSALTLGGQTQAGQTNIEEDMNQILVNQGFAGYRLNQAADGIVRVTGTDENLGEVEFALLADNNNIVKVADDVPPGISLNEAGQYVMTTDNKKQFTFVPAPKDIKELRALVVDLYKQQGVTVDTNNVNIKLGTEGDVLLAIDVPTATRTSNGTRSTRASRSTRVYQVVQADPFLERSSGNVGIQTTATGGISVTYSDQTRQNFVPGVLAPAIFVSEALKLPDITRVIANANGSFAVTFNGVNLTLTPTFGQTTQALRSGQVVNPSVVPNANGTWTYHIQQSTSLIIMTLVVK